jgi:hypothetical protein
MDIFEDVRKKLGCDYISDLRYRRTAARNALKDIDTSKYSCKQVNDFLTYITG